VTIAARHGTRRRYVDGCRCEDCTEANRLYFRHRRAAAGDASPPAAVDSLPAAGTPGPVESGVQAEIAGLSEDRPGLAQVALALARILDNQRAVSSQPAAAKVLAALLDKLHSVSARGRRGGLALVRTMTEKGGA
jgi:hypothetical protein